MYTFLIVIYDGDILYSINISININQIIAARR